MTSAKDYVRYTQTREYQRFSWKTKMKLAWEEDKRRWRDNGWVYRIFVCILLRIITIPLLIAVVICMWALAAFLLITRGIFELLCHWQTYAIAGLAIAIILLVHFGVI